MPKIREEQLVVPMHSTIAVLAPPSSGKRRFCRGVGQHSKIFHVETGELLRQTKDPDIIETMSSGEFVDTERVFKLAKAHISKNFDHHKHHFLFLDGFPRDAHQVALLAKLAIGRIHIVQLKISDKNVRRRFLNSMENDPERKARPDNSVEAFNARLRDYRHFEPMILSAAAKMGIPVFKREISNTDHAADEFHRIHIAGRRNLRSEGAHPHHH